MKTRTSLGFDGLAVMLAAIIIWLLFLAFIYHLQNPIAGPGWQDIFTFIGSA